MFNFHKYMNRALEEDFKKVVGISWYLWIFVVIFLLLNIHGWHAYFWIAFIPIIYPFQRTKLHHICAVYFEWPSERTDGYILPCIVERDLRRFANLRSTSSELGLNLPLHEVASRCGGTTVYVGEQLVIGPCGSGYYLGQGSAFGRS
ncbi:unnamed protein product [Vicia faba]|uniref:Uncharacterized protein n=1 Tax=Vicia faba TaxID=3906 RepID=A0AAV1AGW4_VICFA|nr:unnamed protein product [Vicia faba]